MKLITGLGNPGSKYENTRHNAGFVVVSKLAEKHSIQGKSESKFNSIIGKGKISGEDVIIMQPLTYMNLSGQALSAVMNFYKIEKENIIIVYDDISLDMGVVRFRANGTDGGHNGIKSIIQHLGGDNKFARLKVGIGPQPQFLSSENFVLQKFTQEETNFLQKIIPVCEDSLEFWLKNDTERAMNKFNGTKVQP